MSEEKYEQQRGPPQLLVFRHGSYAAPGLSHLPHFFLNRPPPRGLRMAPKSFFLRRPVQSGLAMEDDMASPSSAPPHQDGNNIFSPASFKQVLD